MRNVALFWPAYSKNKVVNWKTKNSLLIQKYAVLALHYSANMNYLYNIINLLPQL